MFEFWHDALFYYKNVMPWGGGKAWRPLFICDSIIDRWTFSEYLTDDGVGTITTWMQGLDDEVQAQIDTRLLQWANLDKWNDAYAAKFEDLKDLQEIPVLWKGSVYRILGSPISIWEFVMLIGYTDDRRRNKVPREVKVEANDRLNKLRANPERRREYKSD